MDDLIKIDTNRILQDDKYNKIDIYQLDDIQTNHKTRLSDNDYNILKCLLLLKQLLYYQREYKLLHPGQQQTSEALENYRERLHQIKEGIIDSFQSLGITIDENDVIFTDKI